MSEPLKVLVVLWDDAGTPNCDIYRNVPEFLRCNPTHTPEDAAIAREALEEPGRTFQLDSFPFHYVTYRTVSDI